jgi:hypothetical protein
VVSTRGGQLDFPGDLCALYVQQLGLWGIEEVVHDEGAEAEAGDARGDAFSLLSGLELHDAMGAVDLARGIGEDDAG